MEDIQHQLFHITLSGRLHLSPLSDNISSVLDIADELLAMMDTVGFSSAAIC
jgi:hypothetical protein